jgi:hypothetical protein
VSEEGDQEAEGVDNDGGKSEPPKTFVSVVEGINNERKCLMRMHFENKMMAGPRSVENDCTLFSTK